MAAFLKFKDCDIISTVYKTYPVQSEILTVTSDSNVFETSKIYIETEGDFSIGQSRSYFDVKGNYVTGSWNLSGAIQLIKNAGLSSGEKYSLNRLRNIYASGAFVRPENYISSSIFSASTPVGQYMTLINVPSVVYGSEIKPGSFYLSMSSGPSLMDDGYGGILSNSVVIGSIFYQHGIIMLGHKSETFSSLFNNSRIVFSGTNEIPCTMYICNASRGLSNFSNNVTFTVENTSSHKEEITTKENETFITTIGLYDEEYKLIGVAKVSKPIMNKEDTSVSFRLKLNY